METIDKNQILFAITIEDIQYEAQEKIGRRLNEDEIEIARKGLESGLLFDISTIYSTIFNEMLDE